MLRPSDVALRIAVARNHHLIASLSPAPSRAAVSLRRACIAAPNLVTEPAFATSWGHRLPDHCSARPLHTFDEARLGMALATLSPINMNTRSSLSAAAPTAAADHSCPSCGYDFSDPFVQPSEAQTRIRELESQVRLLNTKAANAVDKLADYEDELRVLRDVSTRAPHPVHAGRPSLEGPGPAVVPSQQQTPSQQPSRLASLSSFFPGRRRDPVNPNLPATPATSNFSPNNNSLSPPKTPFGAFGLGAAANSAAPSLYTTHSDSQLVTLSTLQSSLEEERTLRQRAETSLTQAQTELEELTAQLFGQANEMVATERRARAKLEERVKILEQRDAEKRKRLDRLEKAVLRIERVRGMVGP